jgi:leader peptidase (prepilin peptidase) / N-methyltransferase
MNLTWVASAIAATSAVAGIVGGLALRGEVVRLSVPVGEPEQVGCPRCAAWLPCRPALLCEHCGGWIGTPLAFEVATASVVGLLVAKFWSQAAIAAFVYLGVVGVALAQIDVAVKRLPDRLTLPAYPALTVLLAAAAAVDDQWTSFASAILGALASGAGYALLALISGGKLGVGDVKVAGLIGLLLGWLSWRTLVAGACAGFVLAGLVGIALVSSRRVSLSAAVSFGPYLLGGALLAALAADPR